MITCLPELSVPLPSTKEEKVTLRDRVNALFNSAEFLINFGADDQATPADKVTARAVATENISPTELKTPAAVLHVKAVLDECDQLAVKSAQQIRNYVTNNLVLESQNPDPKIRMKALELLGKIGDVGLFAERTEITVQHKTTIELAQGVREKIAKLLQAKKNNSTSEIVDVEVKDIPPPSGFVEELEG